MNIVFQDGDWIKVRCGNEYLYHKKLNYFLRNQGCLYFEYFKELYNLNNPDFDIIQIKRSNTPINVDGYTSLSTGFTRLVYSEIIVRGLLIDYNYYQIYPSIHFIKL